MFAEELALIICIIVLDHYKIPKLLKESPVRPYRLFPNYVFIKKKINKPVTYVHITS